MRVVGYLHIYAHVCNGYVYARAMLGAAQTSEQKSYGLFRWALRNLYFRMSSSPMSL